MKNPLGNDGILSRAIPWISIAIAAALAAAAFSGNSSVTVKTGGNDCSDGDHCSLRLLDHRYEESGSTRLSKKVAELITSFFVTARRYSTGRLG